MAEKFLQKLLSLLEPLYIVHNMQDGSHQKLYTAVVSSYLLTGKQYHSKKNDGP